MFSPVFFFVYFERSEKISTSAEYSSNGENLLSVTDSRGNTTSYTYNNSGLPSSVTDAKNNTTTYYYDLDWYRQTYVGSGNSFVEYFYNYGNKQLEYITTYYGLSYYINYDSFGRKSSVQVGGYNTIQLLSSYQYKDNYSSLLSRMSYGNGDYITYSYDSHDRLISEALNGVTSKQYTYDKAGNISSVKDLITNVTYGYSYDLIDTRGRFYCVDKSSKL